VLSLTPKRAPSVRAILFAFFMVAMLLVSGFSLLRSCAPAGRVSVEGIGGQ
jgi:hypothetical protein